MIEVREIFNADIYRDGGSLSFCFYSGNDDWYEFFLPTRPQNDGYHAPKLFHHSVNDGSPLHEFSWDEALEFVTPLEFDNPRFRQLVTAVRNKGEIMSG